MVRIYPAFIIASLFCLLVVAPLAGARLEQGLFRTVAAAAFRITVLARPMLTGAFPGQHGADWASALNGAMWTIQYEFLCYLLVIALGFLGFLRRPALLVVSALLCLAAGRMIPPDSLGWPSRPAFLPGPPAALFRLIGMFLAGAAFHALQGYLRFRPASIVAAALGLAATIRFAPLTDIGIAVFGGYLIFAAAGLGGSTWLARVNDRNDISYGVYLYAWPTQRLLMQHFGLTSLLPLAVLTWIIAVAFGWASWLLIEKPALRWARDRLPIRGRRPSTLHVAERPSRLGDRPVARSSQAGAKSAVTAENGTIRPISASAG